HLRPAIFDIACIGTITNEEHLADGRYNLLLHGLRRIRVIEELPEEKLYRSARVELLEDVEPSAKAECRLRKELVRRVPGWFAAHAGALQQAKQLLRSGLDVATLCDIFSFALPLDLAFKQRLLEERDVSRRAR